MKRKIKGLLFSMPVLMAFGMMYGYREYHRKPENTADMKESFQLTSSGLAKDFETDENVANAKYLGKVVSVTGTVAKIEMSDSSQVIFLTSRSPLALINCQFEKGYENKITRLRQGQSITVKGICAGMLMDVVLIRCVLNKSIK